MNFLLLFHCAAEHLHNYMFNKYFWKRQSSMFWSIWGFWMKAPPDEACSHVISLEKLQTNTGSFWSATHHSSEWMWASQLSELWGSAGWPLVSAVSSLSLTKLTLQLWLLTYMHFLPTSPSKHQLSSSSLGWGQNSEPVVSRQVKAGAEPRSQHPSEVMGWPGQRLRDEGVRIAGWGWRGGLMWWEGWG